MRLYELTDDLQQVDQWMLEHDEEIRAADGAIPAELAALLASAEGNFDTKASRVALMVINIKSTADAIALEIKRLTARKQAAENAALSLKNYLLTQMQLAKREQIKTPLVTMWTTTAKATVRGALTPEQLFDVYLADDGLVSREIVPESAVYTLDKDAVIARAETIAVIEAKRREYVTQAVQQLAVPPEAEDDLSDLWAEAAERFPLPPALPAGLSVGRTVGLTIR